MNHRERIIKTLNGEPIDRLARGEFFIAAEFVRAFLALDAATPVTHAHRVQVIEQLDADIAAVALSEGWGALAQPDEDRAIDSLARWHAESDRFVFAVIDGPFSAAVKAAGFDALMKYIHSIPHVATDYFRRGADEARVMAQAARAAGADGVVLGEDLAYNRSTFFSSKQLRECYFPALHDAAQAIQELGLVAFFHSDGNLNAILPDLAASGVDGVQGLEPTAGMSVRNVREKIGGALTLWGNLSFELLNHEPSEQEIDAAIQTLVVASPRRLIIGSCGGLVDGMNVETVRQVYRRLGD